MENVFPKALNKNIFPFSCSEEMDDSVLPLDAYQKKVSNILIAWKFFFLNLKYSKKKNWV